MKICFICHANICRSFIAQEILKKLLNEKGFAAEVFSRGIYADSALRVPGKIRDFLKEAGVPATPHTATLVSKADMDRADLILVMESRQLDSLKNMYSQHSDKMFLVNDYAFGKDQDIEDPIGLNGREFLKTAGALESAVKNIACKITNPKP